MHLDEDDIERLGRLASVERRLPPEQAGWMISLALRDWEDNHAADMTLEAMSDEFVSERD